MKIKCLKYFVLALAFCAAFLLSSCAACSCPPVTEVSCPCEDGECDCAAGKENNGGVIDNDDLYLPGVGDNDIPVIDLSAATRTVLSSVAIRATAEVNDSYDYEFDFGNSVRDVTKAGSGIIYSLERDKGNAYILTNFHVLYNYKSTSEDGLAHTIKLYLYGQEEEQYAIPATYVGGSLVYDFAILRVEGSEVIKKSHAIPAVFADSEKVDILDPVVAVGDPEGLGMSITTGTVCVPSEMLEMTGADNCRITVRVMRIDAAINEGNSGGGLFNANGLLIGLVNAKRIGADVDNIAYAFPSNLVKILAENVIYQAEENGSSKLLAYDLGIELYKKEAWLDIDPDTGRIVKREMAAVKEVASGGALDGLILADDVIESIEIDGKLIKVEMLYHFTDNLLTLRPGTSLTLNVLRGNGDIAQRISVSIEILRAMEIDPDRRR